MGTDDQHAITRLFERVASDEQLLKSLMVEDLSDPEILAIQEGIAQAKAGNVRPLHEFDSAFRVRNGFAAKQ
ncbi:MAG: hypothetical protein KDB03_20605 [Planctomycetales bacterium]|nr:hypothetical protein [Planctomycetales bacterium]